jgi:hypothetical protein
MSHYYDKTSKGRIKEVSCDCAAAVKKYEAHQEKKDGSH